MVFNAQFIPDSGTRSSSSSLKYWGVPSRSLSFFLSLFPYSAFPLVLVGLSGESVYGTWTPHSEWLMVHIGIALRIQCWSPQISLTLRVHLICIYTSFSLVAVRIVSSESSSLSAAFILACVHTFTAFKLSHMTCHYKP